MGVVAFGPLAATPDEIVERLFRINTLGALWLAKAAIPALTKSQGFLVHISGIIADMPMPGLVTYSVLVGSPPALPKGADPHRVGARIVRGIQDGERLLPASAFDATS